MIPIKLLEYHNVNVVERFTQYYAISKPEAEVIFGQLKLFLYASVEYSHDRSKRLNIVDETFIIDEMWHFFILFTQDYYVFCMSIFNEFYHHVPSSTRNESISVNELREQMQYIADVCGEETVTLWYQDWALKYNARKMHALSILPELDFE
ncbi:hypothetical protein [Shewanella surugensis]|uniref:Uncharacterized protein n=1 Tax=Shewanella surugensis TaxID=212020 RepID=A0ABT0LCT4_9GAMM|nr:hypothetical protein [Shewanella surugensis]MCL1125488.1 hypothetical protein [Shewanella surugensis]